MFMKNIRGTVAYFKNALFNLLSMFKSLGPPTLFMTLSADDVHWPELGMLLENLTYEEAVSKGSFSTSMRKDPLMTAIHFERRFSALMKFVILSNLKPLGNVKDYFVRVEFQNRGSPHYHIFFWIEKIPPATSADPEDRAFLLSYINKTIVSNIPDANARPCLHELVTRLQTHSHTKYCMPSSRPPCRFHFPKQPCSKTQFLPPILIKKNKGKFYITKRNKTSMFINAYNPIILQHWRANMDIQMINNADGAAYYVCHYLCKSEPDELKGALSNLIHSVFVQNPSMSVFQRLWNIGVCVLKHRRLSAQEAAFRLSNLKLIQMSRSIVYVNTRPLEKRFKMLKPISELQELNDNSTNIFMTNLLDYYRARPNHMEKLSFFYFATWYTKCPKPKQSTLTDKRSLQRIYIDKYDVWLKLRSKASVIRYPAFSVTNDDYFFALLMLLLPHRQEHDLVGNCSCAKDAFVQKQNFLNDSIELYHDFSLEVENSIRRIRLAEGELNSSPLYETGEGDSTPYNVSFLEPFPLSDIHLNTCLHYDTQPNETRFHELSACTMSSQQFDASIAGLTVCQKKLLHLIQTHYTLERNTPLHLFITGGAGVGKSYVLKIIVAYLQLHTASLSGVSPVKLCAPTGTAARHINGFTIHSLLKIPVDKYLTYTSLTAFQQKRLMQMFAGVHTLIIDEISMVSDKMLTYISRRMSEISGNVNPFGGLNVIVVGDFFQLRPVYGKYAFQNKLLWTLFDVSFLRTNVRQNADNSYCQLLNRVRVGLPTTDDIDFLKSLLVPVIPDQVVDTLSLYPTRAAVQECNLLLEKTLSGPKYCIIAEHYFSPNDPQCGEIVTNEFIPQDDKDAGGLPRKLQFSIGSRIMLIRNLCTEKGLVNGAIGRVSSVSVDDLSNCVTHINIFFDDRTVGNMCSDSNEHIPIPIKSVEHEYILNGRVLIRRTFPLTLCWACTIHKVQGMSLPSANIDLSSSVFQQGMAYVALSRVTTTQNLRLLAFSPRSITVCDEVLLEYERLRNIQS